MGSAPAAFLTSVLRRAGAPARPRINRAALRLALPTLLLAVLVVVTGAAGYSTVGAGTSLGASGPGAGGARQEALPDGGRAAALVGCTKTWDGPASGGTWNTANNWDPNGVPGAGDAACIPAGVSVTAPFTGTTLPAASIQNEGTLQITGGALSTASFENAGLLQVMTSSNSNLSIGRLQSAGTVQLSAGTLSLTNATPGEESATAVLDQSGGTLTGAAALTISSASSWTGGTQSGVGRTVVAGTVTVVKASTISPTFNLTQRALTVAGGGVLRVSGVGNASDVVFRMNQGATVETLPEATFDLASDGMLTGETGGAVERFVNGGTLTKSGVSAGGGSNINGVELVNQPTGAVTPSIGNLRFSSGGDGADTTTGRFGGTDDGDAGTPHGVVVFGTDVGGGGTFDLGPGTVFDGAVALAGGTLNTPPVPEGSPPPTVTSGATLTQNFGVVTGPGPLVVNGTLAWQSGTQSGTGETLIGDGGVLTRATGVGGTPTLDTRMLTIGAGGAARPAVASGTTVLQMHNGATVRTLPGGTFDFQSDGTILGRSSFDPAPERFVNEGTLTKSAGAGGASTLNQDVELVNTGLVRSSFGTLELRGGDGAGDSRGRFGGTDDGDPGTPAGVVEFDALGAGAWDLRDGTLFDGAVRIVNGTLAIPGGETAYVTAGATTTQSGQLAVIGGAGTLQVDGTLAWNDGKHLGSGTTIVAGTLLKGTTTAGASLEGRTLLIAPGGEARLTSAAGHSSTQLLRVTSGGTLKTAAPTGTQPGGELEFQIDGTILGQAPGPNRFLNEGTLTKTGGTAALGQGSRVGSLDFVNRGVVTGTVGALILETGDGAAAPDWDGAQSGRFGATDDGVPETDPAAVVFGTGAFDLADGTIFDGTVQLSVGTVTIPSGVVVPVAAGTTTTQVTGARVLGAGTLAIHGHLLWLNGDHGAVDASTPGVPVGVTAIKTGGSATRSGGGLANLRQRTLRIEGGGVFTIEGGSSGPMLWNSARVEVDAGGTIDFTGNAVLDSDASTPRPLVVNNGTIKKSAGTNASAGVVAANDNQGLLLVEAGAGWMYTGRDLQNHDPVTHTLTGGTFEVKDVLLIADIPRNPPAAPYDGRVFTNAAHVILDGPGAEIRLAGGTSALAGLDTNAAGGRLTLKNGKALSVSSAFTNAGHLEIDATSSFSTGGAAFTNTGAGTIGGTGTLSAPVTNNGTLAPGQSAGTLNVSGSYTQGSAGTLAVELGGLAAGTEHDQLAISGAITLGGTLDVTTIGGFTPGPGDTFTIATGSSVTGNFANVAGSLPGGLSYEVSKTATTVVLSVVGAAPDDGPVADFNGDGDTEVGIFRPSSGLWALRGLDWAGFGGSGDKPVPADYDGDGDSEIAIFKASTGLWAIRGQDWAGFGGPGDIPVPADYDGDGDDEIAIYKPSTGLWAIRGQDWAGFGGSAGDIPVPADYDGDGDEDIAIFQPSTGLWAIRGQNWAGFGGPGDIPVPADYDGDGDDEIAIYKPSTGLWAIRGQDWAGFGGSPGDIPVPGDYDGDGDDDIAIYQPSTGLWAIRGQDWAGFGGAAGDIPLPLRPALHSHFGF